MKTKKAYFQIGVMRTKIGCSDQALMPRKRKIILTHVWYQNKPHIKIFKDGFPDFSSISAFIHTRTELLFTCFVG